MGKIVGYIFNEQLFSDNRQANANVKNIPIDKFTGYGKGKSVCLVSAGASLTKNIDKVKGLFDSGMDILCIDKSLNYLLARGIQPKAVCSIDPRVKLEVNFRSSLIILFSLRQNNPEVVSQFDKVVFCEKSFEYSDTISNFLFGLSHFILGYDFFYLAGYDFVIKNSVYSLPGYAGKGITKERRKIVYYEGDKQVAGEVSYPLFQGYKSLRKYIAKYNLKNSIQSLSNGLPLI